VEEICEKRIKKFEKKTLKNSLFFSPKIYSLLAIGKQERGLLDQKPKMMKSSLASSNFFGEGISEVIEKN